MLGNYPKIKKVYLEKFSIIIRFYLALTTPLDVSFIINGQLSIIVLVTVITRLVTTISR